MYIIYAYNLKTKYVETYRFFAMHLRDNKIQELRETGHYGAINIDYNARR